MIVQPSNLPLPRRVLCKHSEVISFLENKFRCELLISGLNFAENRAKTLKFRISVSNVERYSAIDQWFVKIPEQTLVDCDYFVVWGGWTSFGWVIPAKEFLTYLHKIKKSDTGEARWDPRFGIVDGEGQVWTDAEVTAPWPISEFHVDFHAECKTSDVLPPETTQWSGASETTDTDLGQQETPSHFLKRAERDQANRELGYLGERFILENEKRMLMEAGRHDLAGEVRHMAARDGSDKLGFDILSFTPDERKVHIEVKTTRGTSKTPFFISENELKFARDNIDTWQLARVIQYGSRPLVRRIFHPLDAAAILRPISYSAKLMSA